MFKDGALTERLRGGLQNLLNGFDSHTCLHILTIRADGGIGRHERLKISWPLRSCGFKSRSAHQRKEVSKI